MALTGKQKQQYEEIKRRRQAQNATTQGARVDTTAKPMPKVLTPDLRAGYDRYLQSLRTPTMAGDTDPRFSGSLQSSTDLGRRYRTANYNGYQERAQREAEQLREGYQQFLLGKHDRELTGVTAPAAQAMEKQRAVVQSGQRQMQVPFYSPNGIYQDLQQKENRLMGMQQGASQYVTRLENAEKALMAGKKKLEALKPGTLEYQAAAGEMEKLWANYQAAYEGYQNWEKDYNREYNAMEAERKRLGNWRKTVRAESVIQQELLELEQKIKALEDRERTEEEQARKDRTFLEKMGSYLGMVQDTTLPLGATYAGTGTAPETDAEMQALLAEKSRLQEELEWSRYYKYDPLMASSDFEEKSQYVSRPREKKRDNFGMVMGDYGSNSSPWEDPLYEFVNGNEEAGAYLSNQAAANYGGEGLGAVFGRVSEDKAETQTMTDREIAIFNYIYNTEGKNAAHAYYEEIHSSLTYRQRKAEEEKWARYAAEDPVGASAFSVLMSPAKGLSYLGQTADYLSTGKIDQNAGYNKFSYAGSAIRNQVAQQIEASGKWGKYGSKGYQLGMSMADSLFSTVISGGKLTKLGPTLSLAIMGTGAAADTTIAAKDRGLSDDQAFKLGTVAGLAEIATERMGLDALFDTKLLRRNKFGYWLQNVLAEGAEEVSSDVINLVADILISKDESQWRQSIESYMAEGLTESEAIGRAVTDQALSMGADLLGGMISGGVMGGGGVIVQKVNESSRVREISQALNEGQISPEFIRQTIEAGLELDPKGRSYKLAEAMQKKVDAGQEITARELGQLWQANEAAIKEGLTYDPKSEIYQRAAELHIRETLRLFEASVRSGETETVYNTDIEKAAQNLGEEYRNSFIRNYDGQTDVETYEKAYRAFALEGQIAAQRGKDTYRDAVKRYDAFADVLGESARTEAYAIGKTTAQAKIETKIFQGAGAVAKTGTVHFDGDRSKLTQTQKINLSSMEVISRALGVDIHVFESQMDESGRRLGRNGWYDVADGSIHIDLHAGTQGKDTMLFTAAHELTHYIRAGSEDSFQRLALFLEQEYGKTGVSTEKLVQERIRNAKRQGRTLSYEEAYEEMVADSMETMLADGKIVEKLQKLKGQNKSLWQKIKDFVGKLAKKIRKVYEGLRPDSKEGKLVQEMAKTAESLEKLFYEGLKLAKDGHEGTQKNTTPRGGVKMQLRAVNGTEVVWIEENILKQNKGLPEDDFIAMYIAEHIGEVYTILESGQKVYIGEDLPGEFTQSKYTRMYLRKNPGVVRAKKRSVPGLGEMIEIATNRRWEKTKHSHNKDAKYGMYRYDSRFGFPVKNSSGKIVGAHVYNVELLIRNASDGKKYLYDIVNINKDTTVSDWLSQRVARGASYLATQKGDVYGKRVPQDKQKVKKKKPSERYYPETEEDREESWEDAYALSPEEAAEAAEIQRRLESGEYDPTGFERRMQAVREATKAALAVGTEITGEWKAVVERAVRGVIRTTNELLEYQYQQGKRSTGRTYEQAVRKVAREFRQETGTKIPMEELEKALSQAAAVLASTGDANKAFVALKGIVEQAMKQATTEEGSLYDQYAGARKYFRKNTIVITKADAADIPDFYDFRKRNTGRMITRTTENRAEATLDMDWEEICGHLQGLVDSDTLATSDKLLAIEEALNSIYSNREVPMYSTTEIQEEVLGRTASLLNELATMEFKEVTIEDRRLAGLVEDAQKADQEAKRALRAGRTAVIWETRKAVAALEMLVRETEKAGVSDERMDELVQEAKKQIQLLDIRAKLSSANPDEAYHKVIQMVERTSKKREAELYHAQERLEMAEGRFAQYAGRLRENREKSELRSTVYKRIKKIQRKVLDNSKSRHVPAMVREPIAQFLSGLDILSKGSHTRGELTKADEMMLKSMSRLREIFSDPGNHGVVEISDTMIQVDGVVLDIPPDLAPLLEKELEKITKAADRWDGGEKKALYEMDMKSLQNLNDILSIMEAAIVNANEYLSGERGTTMDESAGLSVEEFEATKPKLVESKMDVLQNKYSWESALPAYAFARLGKGAKAVWDSLVEGWEKLAQHAKEIKDFSESTFKHWEVKQWETAERTFTTERGETIYLTDAHIMGLVTEFKRKQARDHITQGGVQITPYKTKGGMQTNGRKFFRLTPGDISKMEGMLTKRQKDVCKALQGFMQETGAKWGNEVTLRRWGIKKFGEKDYYPIKVVQRILHSTKDSSGQNQEYRLINLGASKETKPGANIAVAVSSIFDTYSDHMAEMARYNALALPVVDAMRWFNHTVLDENGVKVQTVNNAMQQAFGAPACDYFRKLIQDLNSNTTGENDMATGFARKMLRNYKAAVIAYNLGTVLKQPLSYVKAGYVLKQKHLIRAFGKIEGEGKKKFRQEREQMLQNSGMALWKDLGFYSPDIGPGLKHMIKQDQSWHDKQVEFGMKGAGEADMLTMTRLWIACKWQVAEESKTSYGNVDLQKVKRLFNEVIFKTQVVDSTITRTQQMREKGLWQAMNTAFGGEPTTAMNMLMEGYYEYQDEKRRSGKKNAWQKSKGKLTRGIAVYTFASVAEAIVSSLIDAWRDDDEYQNYWEKYLEALFGKYGLDGNLLGSWLPHNKVFFLKDIVNALSNGGKTNRMDLDGLVNLGKQAGALLESFRLMVGLQDKPTELTGYGKKTWYGLAYDTLKVMGQISGMGEYNVIRTGKTAWNNAANTWNALVDGFGWNTRKLGKLRSWDGRTENAVLTAFQEGQLTAEEAAEKLQEVRALKGETAYSQNQLYWKLKKADTGYGSTDELDLAVLSGNQDLIAACVKELEDHSDKKPTEPIKAAILRIYRDSLLPEDERNKLYEGQTIDRAKAEQLLRELTEMEEYEIFTALEKKEYAAAHDGEEGFSVYKKVYEAMLAGEDVAPLYEQLEGEGFHEDQITSGSRTLVRTAYQEGELSREETERILGEYYGITKEKDLYEWFGKADYESQGYGDNYSAYKDVYAAVADGKDISKLVGELVSHGFEEGQVYSQAVGEVSRLYQEGELSDTQAAQLVAKYGRTKETLSKANEEVYKKQYGYVPEAGEQRRLTEHEVYWKTEEWKWKKANPDSAEAYSKYAEFYQAVESGRELKKTIQYYMSHGMTAEQLAGEITRRYKEQYLQLRKEKKFAQAANLAARLLTAWERLGYNRSEMLRKIQQWE